MDNLIMGSINNKGYIRSNVNPILEPIIHNFIVTTITDVTMTIQAYVNPNNAETTVSLFNGVTEIPLPNIPIGDTAVLVTYTITGLLPYTNYSLRLEATNSAGSDSTATLIRNTLEPLELTDGNWHGMYEAASSRNILDSINRTWSLMDIQYPEETLGIEKIPDPEFNSLTGWSTNAGVTLVDGKMRIQATGTVITITASATGSLRQMHRVNYRVNITQGTVQVRLGLGDNNIAAGYWNNLTNGEQSVLVHPNYEYARTYIIASADCIAEIEYLSVKQVLKYGIQSDDTSYHRRTLITDYLPFDGSDARLYTVGYASSIGTVYANVRKIGIDDDFILQNTLTGIGSYASSVLRLGTDGTVFYNFYFKSLRVRSITDDADTIAKLNEWFSRESHELPETPGILATGVWNDDAVDNDNSIFKDSPE